MKECQRVVYMCVYVCACTGEVCSWNESMSDSHFNCVRKYVRVSVQYIEYHRASSPQLVDTNVLVYVRACASSCVRYRSGKSNYGHEYLCTSVCLFVRQQTSIY